MCLLANTAGVSSEDFEEMTESEKIEFIVNTDNPDEAVSLMEQTGNTDLLNRPEIQRKVFTESSNPQQHINNYPEQAKTFYEANGVWGAHGNAYLSSAAFFPAGQAPTFAMPQDEMEAVQVHNNVLVLGDSAISDITSLTIEHAVDVVQYADKRVLRITTQEKNTIVLNDISVKPLPNGEFEVGTIQDDWTGWVSTTFNPDRFSHSVLNGGSIFNVEGDITVSLGEEGIVVRPTSNDPVQFSIYRTQRNAFGQERQLTPENERRFSIRPTGSVTLIDHFSGEEPYSAILDNAAVSMMTQQGEHIQAGTYDRKTIRFAQNLPEITQEYIVNEVRRANIGLEPIWPYDGQLALDLTEYDITMAADGGVEAKGNNVYVRTRDYDFVSFEDAMYFRNDVLLVGTEESTMQRVNQPTVIESLMSNNEYLIPLEPGQTKEIGMINYKTHYQNDIGQTAILERPSAIYIEAQENAGVLSYQLHENFIGSYYTMPEGEFEIIRDALAEFSTQEITGLPINRFIDSQHYALALENYMATHTQLGDNYQGTASLSEQERTELTRQFEQKLQAHVTGIAQMQVQSEVLQEQGFEQQNRIQIQAALLDQTFLQDAAIRSITPPQTDSVMEFMHPYVNYRITDSLHASGLLPLNIEVDGHSLFVDERGVVQDTNIVGGTIDVYKALSDNIGQGKEVTVYWDDPRIINYMLEQTEEQRSEANVNKKQIEEIIAETNIPYPVAKGLVKALSNTHRVKSMRDLELTFTPEGNVIAQGTVNIYPQDTGEPGFREFVSAGAGILGATAGNVLSLVGNVVALPFGAIAGQDAQQGVKNMFNTPRKISELISIGGDAYIGLIIDEQGASHTIRLTKQELIADINKERAARANQKQHEEVFTKLNQN